MKPNLFLLLGLFCSSVTFGEAWNFRHQDDWPYSCTEGTMQSPIPLNEEEAVTENFPELEFDLNYYEETEVQIMNNGYSVELKVANSPAPTIYGGGLDGVYVLESLHFHWSAEHTVDRYRYPLEAHFVHYAEKYGAYENALNFKDGVAILAVLYETTPEPNAALDLLAQTVPVISHDTVQTILLEEPIILRDLFPSNCNQFFRYHGSLTTPDCSEVVMWTVFAEPSYISKLQLKSLTRIWDEDDQFLAHNYRKLQDINGRTIYFNYG